MDVLHPIRSTREARKMREAVGELQDRYSNLAMLAESNEELLREELAELELALDAEGWQRLGVDAERDFSTEGRRRIKSMARVMYLKNPLIRRAVNVQTYYVFGQGCEITARDDDANDVVQAFLSDHANEAVLTTTMLMQSNEVDLQLEGERFFVPFVNAATGRTVIRTLPSEEVVDIWNNPEDRDEPWFYIREWRPGGVAGGATGDLQRRAYVGWRYLLVLESQGQEVPATIDSQWGDLDVAVTDDGQAVPCYHVKVGGTSRMKFGVPDVYAALDWARAYKGFLEDWASIAKSLARFAWKLSTKAKLADAKARVGSTLSTDALESNPPPGTGSTFIGRNGADMTPIRTSGAQPKADDGLMLRKMVASATDIPDTILGADPDMGNLATAKTLDRPTELAMRSRQTLWADVLSDLATMALVAAIEADQIHGAKVTNEDGNLTIWLGTTDTEEGPVLRDATVDVVFPPILEQSAKERMEAITLAANLSAVPKRTVARLVLSALGVEDIDELVDLLYPDGDPEQLDDADAPPEPPATPEVAAEEEAFREATRDLREQLERMLEPA